MNLSDDQIRGAMSRVTGMAYRDFDVSKLDEQSKRELWRFIRDCEQKIQSTERQVRTQPWKFFR